MTGDQDTALFLDVDGTLLPSVAGEGMIRMNVPGFGAVAYRPAVVRTLAGLPVRQVWLTDWEADAPRHLGPMFPGAVQHLPRGSQEYGWWKLDAAAAWLESNPQINRVVWADDHLAREDVATGLTFRELAEDMLADHGVQTLLVVPDGKIGLTDVELARIAAFTGGKASVELEPEPEDDEVAASESGPGHVEPERDDPFSAEVPVPRFLQPVDDDPFAEEAPRTMRRRAVVPDDDPFA